MRDDDQKMRDDDSADLTHLILDYVAMCEKFGPLNFQIFVDAWKDADAIARAKVNEDRHEEDWG
jgi:hypothetical protein